VLATEAARNGVRIEFSLGRVLRTQGGERVQALQDLRKLRELVTDSDARFVVSADPFSHLHFRAPRELVALGVELGFSERQIEAGLTEWGRLVARNRERTSDSFVEPGVWRVDEGDGGE